MRQYVRGMFCMVPDQFHACQTFSELFHDRDQGTRMRLKDQASLERQHLVVNRIVKGELPVLEE